MSKLFLSDRGCALSNHNEEVTRWRWIKKQFKLPAAATKDAADLWLLASSYEDSKLPLRVRVNGKKIALLKPSADDQFFQWYRVEVPASALKAGVNDVVIDCDSQAMNAWRIGLDGSSDGGNSFLSFDQGKSWQSERLGVYNVMRGEYVIRLRSQSEKLEDAAPPAIEYSDSKHPKLRELRDALPAAIRKQRDPWKQLLALRTYVCSQWTHDPFGDAYCPWDAATILDWAKNERGHAGKGKTAICVHFGVVFAAFATALGHRARCIAITDSIFGVAGHFVAEVYDTKRKAWILHDPNYDVHFETDHPLSAIEISQMVNSGAGSLLKYVRRGEAFPKGPARITSAFRKHFGSGVSYQLIAAWQPMDFLTDPTKRPAHHGRTVYAESPWVWYCDSQIDADRELGMFPNRVDEAGWAKL